MTETAFGAMGTGVTLFEIFTSFSQHPCLFLLSDMVTGMTKFASISSAAFPCLLEFVTHILFLNLFILHYWLWNFTL